MKRSFGGGGSGGGGGHMLRTAQRAMRAAGVNNSNAAQDPFSNSTTNTTRPTYTTAPTYKPNTPNSLSLSSSTALSSLNFPILSATEGPTWPSYSCSSPTYSTDHEFEWECVDDCEDERVPGFCDDFVFGSVPSKDEVHQAVCALQQVLDPASSSKFIKDRLAYDSDKDVTGEGTSPICAIKRVASVGSYPDWIEPSLHICNPGMFQPRGSERVYDAFHLLQTEPSIKRMVISLSSDKAVWDAILNNEVVRELRESLHEADNNVPESSDNVLDGSGIATDIISWIFVNTKEKVQELIEKITKLVNDLIQPTDSEKTAEAATDSFDKKLRTSFLLSVMVLLIVVVTRAHKA